MNTPDPYGSQADVLQALQVLRAAGVPALLWGGPGTGKTAVIVALGRSLGLHVELVVASTHPPEDFSGLPVADGPHLRYAPPPWAERSAELGGVVFFDELSTAPPAVQAALLRVVLEGTVGDLALGAGVWIVAAANRADDAAAGWDLTPPMANRFCHLIWPVDPAAVVHGFVAGWPEPASLTLRADATQIAVTRAVVGAFLARRNDLVHRMPNSVVQRGEAWPSARTWAWVALVLAFCAGSEISETAKSLLVSGLVGDGAALEFLAWERSQDLPDPEDVLADPQGWDAAALRTDQRYAVVCSLVAAVAANSTTDRWVAAMEFVCRFHGLGATDLAVHGVQLLNPHRPGGVAPPAAVLELNPILYAAGLLPRTA